MHKKIQAIIDEAGLPSEQTDELRRELESHFYEKELDLELSGVPKTQIQSQLEADFGDQEVIASYFRWVHQRNIYSFIKTMFKKLIPLFIFILFLSPWLWFDGGENILESRFFSQSDDSIFEAPGSTCECDGSCKSLKWAPFGAKVSACSMDVYYITFLGQPFHLD